MEKKQYLQLDKPVGSWVWDVSYFVADPDELLSFCEKNGITELYMSINDDVTDARYADLIRQCTAKGVRVSALSGHPVWVYPEKRQGYQAFLNRVRSIQSLCKGSARFSGLHMDANPHSLPEAWESNMTALAAPFIDFVRAVREDADEMKLPLEWDLPSWYHTLEDERGGCKLTETIMRICDCVNVLCFRDSAEDQLVALRPNISLARKAGKPIRIACETLNVDEERRPNNNSRITYYEEGYLYMYECIRIIDQTLADECIQYGFAIHDIKRWMTLQPDPLPQYADGHEEMDMDQYLRCLKMIG